MQTMTNMSHRWSVDLKQWTSRTQEPLFSSDSDLDVRGYKWVSWRVWLSRLVVFPLLLFHWWPRRGVFFRCRSCPLAVAEILLITDDSGQQHVVEVQTEEVEEGSLELLGRQEDEWRDDVQLLNLNKTLLRYFVLQGLRYVWLLRREAFLPVRVLNEDWTCRDLHGFQKGLSPREQSGRRSMFGKNLIDIPVKSCTRLLFEEVLNPFYVFQVFSIALWISDNYYYYGVCIIVISTISIGISLYETRKQSITLRNMALFVTDVKIRRNSGEEDCVSSVELVPGDCLIIPQEGLLLPCDAALMAGDCLVNESMLTGESVPVLKTPLPAADRTYSSDTERRHTLFCGTQIIQAKGGRPGGGGGGAVAVVTSTGFFTAKGELVSSIMYPQQIKFSFQSDAMKFLFILGGIAFCGIIYIFVVLFKANVTWGQLIVRCLDIVTIVVPPALPVAITTGAIYAQSRLKKHSIFCINPPRINVCGKVSVFCFDKTGTLTEEGLDVWGVMEGGPAGFSELLPDPKLLPAGHMQSALACCHTVTLLRGQPLGDPLELKMVESTGWIHQEPEGDGDVVHAEFGGFRVLAVMRPSTQHFQGTSSSDAVAIVKRFPFSSALQRMSVVTVAHGGRSALAFLKGSPEMVAGLCRADTVPPQFSSALRSFSSDGLRVLALACKPVDVNSDLMDIERAEVEKDLQFLGLLMLKNLVKPETADVIDIMTKARIRTVMVTGDNILTAVNVAKSCRMIRSDEKVIFVTATSQTVQSLPTLRFSLDNDSTDVMNQESPGYQLAIDGNSFSALCDHFPNDLPKVLMKATIFARMLPNQKTRLVKELQSLNYCVGMCGDGANDCGALKAADVGVSLSEAEASVASPFTSKTENISCVPLLIREGRCSLVMSFSLFRYMVLYSVIQFCSVLILNTVKTTLGDFQFLFCDLFLVTALVFVMGRGGPSEKLDPCRPPGRLRSLRVFVSLLLHTCMIFLGQLAAFFITTKKNWYIPLNSTVFGKENLPNMENNSVFDLSCYQYVFIAVVVSKNDPHNKPFFYNRIFLCFLVVQLAVMTWLVLCPCSFFSQLLQLYNFPEMFFRLLLIMVAAGNFLLCLLVEMLIDLGLLNCLRRLRGERPSKKQYKRLKLLLTPHHDRR